MAPIPITIITGFLGSGKTTLILNLIPQLPTNYRLALLKNEFGDLAIDSQLASSKSISGVQELLNGCICCNLVGQLGDALDTLRQDVKPDRIVIETSGSAFPATLAMEVNRLGRETGYYVLDGVIVVIDVENWKGYEDTSYTARLQARYTDLVVLNKWEEAGERRFDECLDRLGDLEVDVARIQSNRGKVSKEVLLGLDGTLARRLGDFENSNDQDSRHADDDSPHQHGHSPHEHEDGHHHSEVEVLSITLAAGKGPEGKLVNVKSLENLLSTAPKDEVYRIKAMLWTKGIPSTDMEFADEAEPSLNKDAPTCCILNWAFGRWTFTAVQQPTVAQSNPNGSMATPPDSGHGTPSDSPPEPAMRMTIILARHEAEKWKKRLEQNQWICLAQSNTDTTLKIEKIL